MLQGVKSTSRYTIIGKKSVYTIQGSAQHSLYTRTELFPSTVVSRAITWLHVILK